MIENLPPVTTLHATTTAASATIATAEANPGSRAKATRAGSPMNKTPCRNTMSERITR